jgi:hypothetical protein
MIFLIPLQVKNNLNKSSSDISGEITYKDNTVPVL